MTADLGRRIEQWALSASPWTNVYGVCRTLLALATGLTLAVNHSSIIFRPVLGAQARCISCLDWVQSSSLFCLFGPDHLELARWTCVAVLAVVASGWRPRVTAIPHWWVSWSLMTSGTVVDGGDQITMNLTLLFLPIALSDPRRWHWSPAPSAGPSLGATLRQVVARWALLMVRIQVAAVYLHAAVGKFAVEEWLDGTAIYYWIQHPVFGTAGWFGVVMNEIVSNGVLVALICWGTMLLEYFLGAAILMRPSAQRVLLVLGLAFHAAIVLVHGLASFSLAMFGALLVYLLPSGYQLQRWNAGPLRSLPFVRFRSNPIAQ